MRFGRFDLRIRYPKKPQALLLEASKSPHLQRVCGGVETEPYDIANRQIFLRPKYLYYLFVFSRRTSRMAALLCARLKSQEICVLLSLDNHDKFNKIDPKHPRRSRRVDTSRTLFDDVSTCLPQLKILSVQHGWEPRRFRLDRPKKNVTLLCWGQWTARNFPKFGRNERNFVPVGPLIDSFYRTLRPEKIRKDVEICLVSTVKGKAWWGSEVGERQQGYETLVKNLARFTSDRNLVVNVALTIDRDQYGPGDVESERRWFLERLPSVVLTEPTILSGDPKVTLGGRTEPRYVKERYATYLLCDRANLTLGMTSSVLWESFGRGNKLLAINFTQNPIYDFPIPGIWAMRNPSYEQFCERLEMLMAMSDVNWNHISKEARSDLITFDESLPPYDAINRYLKTTVQAP